MDGIGIWDWDGILANGREFWQMGWDMGWDGIKDSPISFNIGGKNIVAGSHSESNAEIDTEVINITEDNAEIESFTQNERNTREKLLEVWAQSKIKKENLKRTMCHRKVENSLNEDQYACLNTILKKQADLIPIIREDTNLLDSYLKIEYLIRPLPSVYLLERFMCTKVPETFDDFEKFSKDMAQLINWQSKNQNSNVCITPLEDSPKKDKKTIKKVNDSY
ncbi:hypothetical protein RhiirA1_455853 [Rhizophagus irregularis]|uniref:Uncharacterized protein n=1 Tax=Rhizophagus irregularis TaxID=588596 RepID=A0A2N0S205_9GLOM|nr:hypothetical protein RhiirA1_455853 [Rhizophagus irregularis]